MFMLLFAAAVSAGSTTGCKLSLEPGDRVVERRILNVRNGKLEAVAIRKSREWKGDPAARMVVLGPDCGIIFDQHFKDADRLLFTEERIGDQPFLFVTATSFGGSGCGYHHTLLTFGGETVQETVQPLAPMLLTHDNMDGIFVGNLGHGQGPGLVLWRAQWNDGESHYQPHQYEVVTYRWRNWRFVGPTVRTTKRKYDPDPNAVARRLGLGFHDMTQRKRGEC